MFRLYGVAGLFFAWCIAYLIWINNAIKRNDPLPLKYKLARKIITDIAKKSLIKVEVTGRENLPEKDGYVLCPNHQGKYDGHAMIIASERQLTFVIDEKRSKANFERQFLDLIEVERLDRTNLRKCVESFKRVEKGIVEKKMNFCIFPEGKHEGNKNNLQEFKTGFTHFLYRAKCPVIPVCLYDTYKPYNSHIFGKVKCSVHFLKPIEYEEYKDLSKKEFAELIKSRIGEKIQNLEKEKGL